MDIRMMTLSTLVMLGSGAAPYAHATRVDTNPNCGDSSAHVWENKSFGSDRSVYDINRGLHHGASTPIQFEPSHDSRYEKKFNHRAEESGDQWSSGGKWHDNKFAPLSLHHAGVNGHLGGAHYQDRLDCTPTAVPLGDSLPLYASALAALGLRYKKRLIQRFRVA